jgi:translation initiation factor IF-2
MDSLDNAIGSLEAWEAKQRSEYGPVQQGRGRVLIGRVEQFFDRIGVAAVTLSGDLRVGDIIEIGSEEEAVRQRVSSMQIDREDVTEATVGDDVGIKLVHAVSVGSEVYRIE